MSGFLILVLAVVVGAILFIASRKPDEFRVTRSATIDAPAPIVFDHINNIHKWQTWSPWARADPQAKSTFIGPESGAGAALHWEGGKTGVGTMTNVESRASEFVKFRLDFEKPFKATNHADFTLVPQGDKTHVTWSMYGPNNLMGKCMSLFIDCEKMMSKQFDEGLGYLNEVVKQKK
jgi:hypothetical protein